MSYDQLESEIVTRLQGYVPAGVEVVPFPESMSELTKPFESAQVTVLYKGSDFGDYSGKDKMRSTSQMVQLETMQLEIIIRSRFLRVEAYSCMNLLTIVRKALLGWSPTDCDRMYGKKQDLNIPNPEEPGDLFTYIASFECTRLVVEDIQDTFEDGALITRITFND